MTEIYIEEPKHYGLPHILQWNPLVREGGGGVIKWEWYLTDAVESEELVLRFLMRWGRLLI